MAKMNSYSRVYIHETISDEVKKLLNEASKIKIGEPTESWMCPVVRKTSFESVVSFQGSKLEQQWITKHELKLYLSNEVIEVQIEAKLKEMGYSLEDFDRVSKKAFETVINIDQILYVSGHAAKFQGELVYKGIIGRDVTVEEGQKAIIYAFLNCLVAIRNEVKDLDLIEQFINLRCYVAIKEEYYARMSEISDHLTFFINNLFGEKGKHTRTTIGVSVLPGNTPVEVDMILKIKEEQHD